MALGGEHDAPAMLAFSPSRAFKVTSRAPIGPREPPDRGWLSPPWGPAGHQSCAPWHLLAIAATEPLVSAWGSGQDSGGNR